MKKRLLFKIQGLTGLLKSTGLTLSFMLLFSAGLLAQSMVVKGTVTDETGVGMPGVNILAQGTSAGTITDIDGAFEIRADKGATLLFSFTGYSTQSIVVESASLNVKMQPNAEVLSEVVVTGYSTQRKRDITGAVSVVDAEELNKINATSFTQKLEGRAAGLTISTSGEPGEGTSVRIRGISSFQNNDPLYIIDGVPVQDAFNTGFNPNDIESIQVLKDASAASIYGARANNGVIIVTTKRGKSGKVRVSYDANVGVATPINTPDYMITDPKDYSNYIWDKHENAGLAVDASNPYSGGRGVLPTYSYPFGSGITPSDADYSFPNSLVMRANQSGTNWFDEVFDPALVTEHNLGVSGGNDLGSYYISAGYTDQNGTMMNNYFKRYSLRANTEFKKGRFTFGENMSLSRVNSVGNDGISGGNQDEQGVMTWVTLMNPLTPIYDVGGEAGGGYGGDKANGLSNGSNPVANLIRNKDNVGTYYRILGNAYAELNFTKNLKARTSFGMDFYNNYRGRFSFPSYENREPSTTNGWTEDWGNGFTWTWTNTLAYNATLADAHNLQVLVGYEAIEGKNRYLTGSLANYFTQNINAWYLNGGLANPDTRQISSGGGRNALASVFGKLDYSYMDKYLVSFTVRRDGSSNFGDEKYGVFPALSLGWRVSGEEFMKSADWLEDLKLRFGWGITGNQQVPGGNAFDRYGGGTASTFYDITGSNNGLTTGYTLTRRGNTKTKWEENISTNFGLDASLFEGKIGLVVDVYNRKVDGLLFPASLPGTAGTAAPAYINIAKMENKGVDLGLDYRNKVNSDFGYSVGITFSQYSNEVVDIDGGSETFFPTGFDSRIGTVNFNKVGLPISTFYGLTADGIFRSQAEVDAHAEQDGKAVGRIRFKDLNGDGVINDDDKGAIGDAHPDFFGGINLGFNYKNFDLSIFLFASVGNQLFNYNKLFDTFGFFNSNVRKSVLTNSFDETKNPNGNLPKLDVNDTYSYQPSSFYVEDASYLRAKNIQLGYTFPTAKLGKVFSSLRVYVQAQNLFTITGYSGLDPSPSNFGVQGSNPNDLNSAIKSDLWNGFDFGNYPASKIFMIGVNAGF
ncbi:MAG: SusC/RagA family TonB-linked outer membrane protein [Bacteroidetes bacterium]|nr:SusC/RagA family TonB-linked outer membrane protein [Bacteroidota bacterium]